MRSPGKISIIIPTHNEDLEPILNSISRSFYPDYEVIVIDEGKERSYQRNKGIDLSTGDYLLILDSDQPISPLLLWECAELMKNYDAVYIPELIMTKGFFGRLRNWERQFYTGTAVDVVRFVKWVGDYLPYFDETLHGPEDTDWDRRVTGKRVISKSWLYHYDNIGVIKYFKKKIYYSKSMNEFAKKNPNDKILDLKWRCWTVFTENGKWKRLIKKPHYTLALGILILVRGVIYLWTKHSS